MAVILLSQRDTFIQVFWGVFCILVAFWGIGAYNIGLATDPATALLWWKVGYIGVTFIPTAFTHFVYEFIGIRSRWRVFLLYGLSTIYFVANVFPNVFMAGVHQSVGGLYFMTPTPLYDSYMLLWIVLIPYAHVLLYQEFKHTTGERREQIKLFFLGSFIGFFGGSFSFLPEYNLALYPYPNIAVCLYPVIMGYAVLKYRLWDFKVVATQAAVFALWVFITARVILSPLGSQDQIIESILLLLTVVVGILLIRSVNKEIRQRIEIEKLSEEKSEFMSFASHEIRNPITAMRGYASLITDGTTGEVNSQVKDAAQKIQVNGDTVLSLISQFLNKSKLELGQIEYADAPMDVGETITSIAEGFRSHAQQNGLSFDIRIDFPRLMAKGDEAKLREVVGNLIDNSMKYTKTGGVTVIVEKRNGMARVVVADTGVGIPHETLPNLFQKFSRADAQKMNLLGTGLGLYLAKTFIEGMGGKIWAESDGKDKGSRFIIELHTAA
jgi:signal transduction histidine kinase